MKSNIKLKTYKIIIYEKVGLKFYKPSYIFSVTQSLFKWHKRLMNSTWLKMKQKNCLKYTYIVHKYKIFQVQEMLCCFPPTISSIFPLTPLASRTAKHCTFTFLKLVMIICYTRFKIIVCNVFFAVFHCSTSWRCMQRRNTSVSSATMATAQSGTSRGT